VQSFSYVCHKARIALDLFGLPILSVMLWIQLGKFGLKPSLARNQVARLTNLLNKTRGG